METVKNVVLVTVDALRADHLSCHGYERETTPTLDSLAEEGLWFETAYSASSHTREAVPGILTGEYPDESVDAEYRLATESVATRLDGVVDATAGFHSNPYLSRAFGYDEGFDTFDDDLRLGDHRLVALAQRMLDKLRNRHYARATEMNERSLSWLDSLGDDSFFLWNHYMDPHGPYLPVDGYRSRYTDRRPGDRWLQRLYKRAVRDPESVSDADRRLLVDCYDAEIEYLDAHLGAFLDGLGTRDVLEETAVVVTADHGDAFGEHGYYEHPRYLHEVLTHVPLLVRLPDASSDYTDAAVGAPVSTLDVVPTLLDLLGADSVDSAAGRSLLETARDPDRDRVVFAQASGEDEDAGLRRFAAMDRTGRAFGVYDGETDSHRITETTDDGLAAALTDHIVARTDHVDPSRSDDASVDDEIERRLSALGYRE
jgi:arylsulfatase